MKIINPNIEIMRTGLETDFMTPEQFIEKVGRTCYKSEDKITEDSAAKFVSNLIKRAHEAMIEHWSLIFRFCNYVEYANFMEIMDNLREHTGMQFHLRITESGPADNRKCLISGNMRAWRDFIKECLNTCAFVPYHLYGLIRNYPLFFPEYQEYADNDLTYDILIPVSVSELDEVERGVHQDVTVKFICDRGVSHEIVRHRESSFAQESTRYCNYSGDKFNKSITVIMPQFVRDACVSDQFNIIDAWEHACTVSEAEYFNLLDLGCSPQEARSVLPNSLKTEIIMTTNLNNWNHFFDLRCAPDAHPDIQTVAKMVRSKFKEFTV